uniref:Uncharacterized protein n=1 Tax=Plectus sambesii TaxID=2011161 RepID=A0A914W8E0_9BILA
MSVRQLFRWLKKTDARDKDKRGQHDEKGVNGIWRSKSVRPPPDPSGSPLSAEQSPSKFDMADALLTHIPEEVFQHVTLRVLQLSGNQLRNLPPSIATFRLLEELILNRNEICDLPETLKFLARLASLELSLNPLNSVSFGTIGQLRALSVLCLNCCSIKSIPNGAMPHSLKWLELRENRLKSLPADFGRLVKLEHLDLDRNSLQSLPDSFANLKRLVSFSCAWNELTSLPETFGSLVSVACVDLSSNFLHSLPNSCQFMERLEDLRLSSNQFQRFPVAVTRCSNLRIFHMNFNRLTEIPEDLQRLRKLTELQVMTNAITTLAGSSSQFIFPLLEMLLCDFNQLTSLPALRCPMLRLLSLRDNRITSLGYSLNELNNLMMLDLRKNMLRMLPISMSAVVENVSALWLTDNQIKSKPPLTRSADGTALVCIYLPQKHEVQLKQMNDAPEVAQWSLAAHFIYKSDLAHRQRAKARMQTGERRTHTAESAVLILPSTIAPRTRPTIRPYAMVDINTLRAQLTSNNAPLGSGLHYEHISRGSTLVKQKTIAREREQYESVL